MPFFLSIFVATDVYKGGREAGGSMVFLTMLKKTGKTWLTFKLDFPGHLRREAFVILAMFFSDNLYPQGWIECWSQLYMTSWYLSVVLAPRVVRPFVIGNENEGGEKLAWQRDWPWSRVINLQIFSNNLQIFQNTFTSSQVVSNSLKKSQIFWDLLVCNLRLSVQNVWVVWIVQLMFIKVEWCVSIFSRTFLGFVFLRDLHNKAHK